MNDRSISPAPRFARLALAALVAAGCLTAATGSGAQTSPPPPMPEQHAGMPPMNHDGHHMEGKDGKGPMMGPMRDLERFKTSLHLTPEQTALWDRAVQQMKPPGDMRERMKADHDRMTAMLDDPAFDPRKMAVEMDRAEAERTTRMKAMRDAWFAVYESLNPVQRGQAREFLREHMMHRPEMHRMKWKHREGGMSWGRPASPQAAPAR